MNIPCPWTYSWIILLDDLLHTQNFAACTNLMTLTQDVRTTDHPRKFVICQVQVMFACHHNFGKFLCFHCKSFLLDGKFKVTFYDVFVGRISHGNPSSVPSKDKVTTLFVWGGLLPAGNFPSKSCRTLTTQKKRLIFWNMWQKTGSRPSVISCQFSTFSRNIYIYIYI